MAARFKAKSYVGTGVAGNAITGIGFRSKFVMIRRLATPFGLVLLDDVSGTIGDFFNFETTSAKSFDPNKISSFDADGFTLGTGVTVNASGETYIAYCWDEATGFFDILTYIGDGSATRTLNHGLGASPGYFITKSHNIDFFMAQVCWDPGGQNTRFNIPQIGQTYGILTSDNPWNGAVATSSQWFVNNGGAHVNNNAQAYTGYFWGDLAGYSKIGSYTGDGANNKASEITCDFQPAMVVCKRMDTGNTGDWQSFDAAQNASSPWTKYYTWNQATGQQTDANGVIITTTGFRPPLSVNANGAVYHFMAFSEAGAGDGGGGTIAGLSSSTVVTRAPNPTGVVQLDRTSFLTGVVGLNN
jgi:hypothetical protein